jgi:hypothetical protein
MASFISSPPIASISNILGADVALNNTSNYFTGPSIAQGTSGTWLATGSVTVLDTGGVIQALVKLWDGTTVIASGKITIPSGAQNGGSITLSGIITNPAGNIRISVRDLSSTNGQIKFNLSGESKDSSLFAIRIA